MGTSRPDDYRDDPVAKAMVTEGVRALQDPTHPVMDSISVAEMARRVGVTARTGYTKWDAEDFHVAIVRQALRFGADPDTNLDAEAMVDGGRAILGDDEVAAIDDLVSGFDAIWPQNIDDPNLRVAFALWPYSSTDSRVSTEIRESMGDHYDQWTERVLAIVDSFLAQHSHRFVLRQGVSRVDLATLMIMLAESAAFHTRIRTVMGQPALPADLPGRALTAFLASVLELHSGDGEHPVDHYLDRLRGTVESDSNGAAEKNSNPGAGPVAARPEGVGR